MSLCPFPGFAYYCSPSPQADEFFLALQVSPALSSHRMLVETAHPYTRADCRTWNLEFPEDTQFITVEVDSRCSTSQGEDKLTLFSDKSCSLQLGSSMSTVPALPHAPAV